MSKYEFKELEIFFLPSFQLTEHQAMSPNAKGFFVHFDETIFDFLPKNFLVNNYSFFKILENPVIKVRLETSIFISAILERLLFLYEDEQEINTNLIASYLM